MNILSIDESLYNHKDLIGYDKSGIEFRLEFIKNNSYITQQAVKLEEEIRKKLEFWVNKYKSPAIVKISEVNVTPLMEASKLEDFIEKVEEKEETELEQSPPLKNEVLFFHDIYELNLDTSLYEDGDLIGYDHKGVEYTIGKIGDSVSYTETTKLDPVGEVLGQNMDAETYQKYKEWLKLEEEKENKDIEYYNESNTAGIVVKYQPTQDNLLNYRFSSEHNLYTGGAKTKFKANVDAIKVLKVLEEKKRLASKEEQVVLAGYVGWGGLANALTPNKAGWEKEYAEIKELLTEKEFESASASTPTAFYTEQQIIEKIYFALHQSGFHKGSILDPSMGTGIFFSVLPESMKESKLFGVEIDSISGRIAQKLYPSADIQVRGYEDTTFPDNFFDVSIGNIPFNSIHISDTKYNNNDFMIHDYFMAKTIDKVRPNGIIAFISTKGTLDKKDPSVRKYLGQRADLVGAIRLPNTAFQQVAGTKATLDILFFQKREHEIAPTYQNTPWLSVVENEDGVPVNQYFIDHPEMLLGKMVFDESMYGNKTTTACHPTEGNLERKLQIAVGYLDFQYHEPTSLFQNEEMVGIIADPSVKNFSYTVVNDEIYFRDKSTMYPQDFTGKKAERIKGMVEIHRDMKSLIEYQSDLFVAQTVPHDQYEAKDVEMRAKLNQDYDNFVKKFGYLNDSANVSAFELDTAASLLRSLKKPKEKNSKVYEKTDIFTKSTISIQKEVKKVDTAQDALMLSMNNKGKLDLEYMSSVYLDSKGKPNSKQVIIEELGTQIFQDPDKIRGDREFGGYVLAEEYLSGYVADKLATARFYAEQNPEKYQKNVDALEIVQPIPLEAHEINFQLGSRWIPTEIYQEFI